MSSAFVAPRGVRPQQSALVWLAVRLGLHVRGATVARLFWLAGGTAVAAGPLIVWSAAAMSDPPRDALPTSTALGLALAACPGIALVLWAARSLAPDRAALAEALRQVGAERAAAWLLPALRIAAAAGLGAVAGAVGQAVLRTTVFRELPRKAPLRATLDVVSSSGWVTASAGIALVLVVGALFASGSGHRLAGRLNTRFRSARAKATDAAKADAANLSAPEAGTSETSAPETSPGDLSASELGTT